MAELPPSITGLLVQLAHELAVSLEMHLTRDELRSGVWNDAIDGLEEVRQTLIQQGIPAPSVVENVLQAARGDLEATPK